MTSFATWDPDEGVDAAVVPQPPSTPPSRPGRAAGRKRSAPNTESTRDVILRDFRAVQSFPAAVPQQTQVELLNPAHLARLHEVAVAQLNVLSCCGLELDLNFSAIKEALQELGARSSRERPLPPPEASPEALTVQITLPAVVGPLRRKNNLHTCQITSPYPCEATVDSCAWQGEATKRSRERGGVHLVAHDVEEGGSLMLSVLLGKQGVAAGAGHRSARKAANFSASGAASHERDLVEELTSYVHRRAQGEPASTPAPATYHFPGISVGSGRTSPSPSPGPEDPHDHAHANPGGVQLGLRIQPAAEGDTTDETSRFLEDVKGYFRFARTCLRQLASLSPALARLLEGAFKGVILAVDEFAGHLQERIKQVEQSLKHSEEQLFKKQATQEALNHVKKQLAEKAEEMRRKQEGFDRMEQVRQERILELQREVDQLMPEDGDVQVVAAQMDQLNAVMTEMEEESARSVRHLYDIQKSTLQLIAKKGEEFDYGDRARVVESTGDVVLRPYAVTDQEVQCTNDDFRPRATADSVLIRHPRIRAIAYRFRRSKVHALSTTEIESEIDKIYDAKIKADMQADDAAVPRRDLPDAVVDFYLQSGMEGLRSAELKLLGLLQHLADRAVDSRIPLTPKVELFSRLMWYCPLPKALPRLVLDRVLKAKTMIDRHIVRPMDSHRGAKQRRDTLQREAFLHFTEGYECCIASLVRSGRHGNVTVFSSLASRSSIKLGPTSGKRSEVQWHCFLSLLYDKKREGVARKFDFDILSKSDDSHVTSDEFRDAVVDAGIYLADDEVWKAHLLEDTNRLSVSTLRALFGPGGLASSVVATIAEGDFFTVLAEGVHTDELVKVSVLAEVWSTHCKIDQAAKAKNIWQFYQVRDALREFNQGLTDAQCLRVYNLCMDISMSCCQLTGVITGLPMKAWNAAVHPGTEAQLFGGDSITSEMIVLAAMSAGFVYEEKRQVLVDQSPSPPRVRPGTGRGANGRKGKKK
mmetsp:Transcript_11518/g.25513  ORF Transcript_11518/g.25513 Transcript_11518/m.25513 type:complete len:984 (-) Transcript_11518:52-3003(-)